jgi:hypothetical protein
MNDNEFSAERSAAIRQLLVREVTTAPVRAERSTTRVSLFAAAGTLLLIAVLIIVAGSVSSVRSTVASLFHPSSAASPVSSAEPSRPATTPPPGEVPEAGAGAGAAVPSTQAPLRINSRGQSYGPAIAGKSLPQLVAVVGKSTDGEPVAGYVERKAYLSPPTGAVVPLLRADGSTVVGTWTASRHD